MAKATAWIQHVAAFRKAHPGMDPKKVFGEAAKTFKKHSAKHSGGSALGNGLSPEPVSGLASSDIDLDTQMATQYGGKKRSTKRSAKKRSAKHSAKRSAKKRSTKRGGGPALHVK
jgi:hypothetical protein